MVMGKEHNEEINGIKIKVLFTKRSYVNYFWLI